MMFMIMTGVLPKFRCVYFVNPGYLTAAVSINHEAAQ